MDKQDAEEVAGLANRPWHTALTPTASVEFACRLLTAIVLVAALIIILINPTRIGHDQAAGLQVGDLLLHRYTLYVDIIDIGPPLFFYLNVIPVAVARLLGLHVIPTFLVGVWLLTGWSVVATRRFLARACGTASLHVDLVALGVAVSSLLVLRHNDFGQREHLFMLGFLPYLTLRFLRTEGGDVAAAPAALIGVLAAIVACQKPHFVAVVLAIELFWSATRPIRGMVRSELVAFLATGTAYGVCLLFMPPAMRAAYFGRWLPLIMSGYRAYDMPWRDMVLRLPWLAPAACALLLIAGDIPGRPIFRLARPVAIATLVAVGGFFVQHKGFPYHLIPAEALLTTMLALVAGEVSLRFPKRAMCAALAVVLAGEVTVAMALTTRPRYDRALANVVTSGIGQAIMSHTVPGDPVLVISTSVLSAYPLLTQLDRRPGSRFLLSWPLPMLYFGVRAAAGQPFDYRLADPVRRAEEASFRADLADDVRTRRPRLVVVDSSCQACPAGFSLRDYLSQTGFLQTSLRDYRELDGFQTASVFVLAGDARDGRVQR